MRPSKPQQPARTRLKTDFPKPSPASPAPVKSGPRTFAAFAVVTPGLEPLACFEIRRMGIHGPRAEPGGVAFQATYDDIFRVNLWSRVSERVLLRVSTFHAATFGELETAARRIAWKKWIRPQSAVSLSVSCRDSSLYHEGAVAERVLAAIDSVVSGIRGVSLSEAGLLESDEHDAEVSGSSGDEAVQRVFVRIDGDVCRVSIDSSGGRLHRRGYRECITAAPLRETLAAALALCGGIQELTPSLRVGSSAVPKSAQPLWLCDPMCGSGTIPIEAARLLCNIAPGLSRSFAFENWPVHDAGRWSTVRREAECARVSPPPGFVILGSDIDASAIASAQSNALRAALPKGLIRWSQCDATSSEAFSSEMRRAPGLVVSNPPYGHRIGESAFLPAFFGNFGRAFREFCPGGSSLSLLLPDGDRAFETCFGIPMTCRTRFRNGGLPVGIWRGVLPADASNF